MSGVRLHVRRLSERIADAETRSSRFKKRAAFFPRVRALSNFFAINFTVPLVDAWYAVTRRLWNQGWTRTKRKENVFVAFCGPRHYCATVWYFWQQAFQIHNAFPIVAEWHAIRVPTVSLLTLPRHSFPFCYTNDIHGPSKCMPLFERDDKLDGNLHLLDPTCGWMLEKLAGFPNEYSIFPVDSRIFSSRILFPYIYIYIESFAPKRRVFILKYRKFLCYLSQRVQYRSSDLLIRSRHPLSPFSTLACFA